MIWCPTSARGWQKWVFFLALSPKPLLTCAVPYGLKRYHETGQTHFVTFSCHDREPHLKNALLADAFLDSLEQVRRRYRMRVFGYVIMPEHVHLLVSEPENGLLSRAIQVLKISMNRKTQSRGPSPLWQKRYYDHNVRSYESFVVKLNIATP